MSQCWWRCVRESCAKVNSAQGEVYFSYFVYRSPSLIRLMVSTTGLCSVRWCET